MEINEINVLSVYYVSGIVLVAGDFSVNKIEKIPSSWSLLSSGHVDNKEINTLNIYNLAVDAVG